MKRITSIVCTFAALAATAACAASPHDYISVERVGIWGNDCGCVRRGLEVRDNNVTTRYFVGEDGLDLNTIFDEDAAVAYVAARHGREPHAIRQPGGHSVDPITGDVDHDSGEF